MPAPRRRSRARGWVARPCCSRTASKRWARCRATRRSAASARATSSRKSTHWAARWRSPPTRRESSFAFSIRARVRPCARRVRRRTGVLYKAAIRRRLENEPNLTLFQQPVDDLTIDDTGGGADGDGRHHADGRDLRGGCGRAHDRHLPFRIDPCRPRALRSGARGRAAGEDARRESARARVAGGPPQDGHARRDSTAAPSIFRISNGNPATIRCR